MFIAAQVPLPCTVTDFWKMVAKNKCSAIVQLYTLSEKEQVWGGGCEEWSEGSEPSLAHRRTVGCIIQQAKRQLSTLTAFRSHRKSSALKVTSQFASYM